MVCGLAALTMNILRLMGQAGLHGDRMRRCDTRRPSVGGA